MSGQWLFYGIFAWGMISTIHEAGCQGLFGANFATYCVFGKVNKERDLRIQKCLAFYDAGKYTAEISNCDKYISFVDLNDPCAVPREKYIFVAYDWNYSDFGDVVTIRGGLTWKSYDTYPEKNPGTISFKTRLGLYKLKHELLGKEFVFPHKKKASVLKRIISKFKKEEVQLS